MAMAKLWAKKLMSKEKTWEEVPESRKKDVETVLKAYAENGKITAQEYEKITGGKV